MNFLQTLPKTRILSSNAIKFLAAAFMLVDHVGFIFFPDAILFRIVGRLSMPLFAFALSEGCRYTKNKAKHFALLFTLAALCQIVYYFFDDGSLYMSILVTFSLSVLCIYALQYFKKRLFDDSKTSEKILAGALLILAVGGTFALNQVLTIDYGFLGCMLPVFASLFDFRDINVPERLQKFDRLPIRVLCLGVGCLTFALSHLHDVPISFYMLLALPILLLYSGEKGKLKTKYFFYVFYPLHLVVLEGIYLFVQAIG